MEKLIINPLKKDEHRYNEQIIRDSIVKKEAGSSIILDKNSTAIKLIVSESICPFIDDEIRSLSYGVCIALLIMAAVLLLGSLGVVISVVSRKAKQAFAPYTGDLSNDEKEIDETIQTLDLCSKKLRKYRECMFSEAPGSLKDASVSSFECLLKESEEQLEWGKELQVFYCLKEKTNQKTAVQELSSAVIALKLEVEELKEHKVAVDEDLHKAGTRHDLDFLAQTLLKSQQMGIGATTLQQAECFYASLYCQESAQELLDVVKRRKARIDPASSQASLKTSIEAQDSHALVVEIERARLNMAETTPMLEEAYACLAALHKKEDIEEIVEPWEKEMAPLTKTIHQINDARIERKGRVSVIEKIDDREESLALQLIPPKDPIVWDNSDISSFIPAPRLPQLNANSLIHGSLNISTDEVDALSAKFQQMGITAEKSREKAVDTLVERSRVETKTLLSLIEEQWRGESRLKDQLRNREAERKEERRAAARQACEERDRLVSQEDKEWRKRIRDAKERKAKQIQLENEAHEKSLNSRRKLFNLICTAEVVVSVTLLLTMSNAHKARVFVLESLFGQCSKHSVDSFFALYYLGASHQTWMCYFKVIGIMTVKLLMYMLVHYVLSSCGFRQLANLAFWIAFLSIFQPCWQSLLTSKFIFQLLFLATYQYLLHHTIVNTKAAHTFSLKGYTVQSWILYKGFIPVISVLLSACMTTIATS